MIATCTADWEDEDRLATGSSVACVLACHLAVHEFDTLPVE